MVQKFNSQIQILSGCNRNQILFLSILLKKKKNRMQFQRGTSLRLMDCPKNLKEISLPWNAKQIKDQNTKVRKGCTYSLFLLLMHGW